MNGLNFFVFCFFFKVNFALRWVKHSKRDFWVKNILSDMLNKRVAGVV